MAKATKTTKAKKSAKVRGLGKTTTVRDERHEVVSCHKDESVAKEKSEAIKKAGNKSSVKLNPSTGSYCVTKGKKTK
jgi:hypothetical protein